MVILFFFSFWWWLGVCFFLGVDCVGLEIIFMGDFLCFGDGVMKILNCHRGSGKRVG